PPQKAGYALNFVENAYAVAWAQRTYVPKLLCQEGIKPACPTFRSGTENSWNRLLLLARDGRHFRGLWGRTRHDHPLAQRHAGRGRRPLLAEVCLLAVLAQVESGELLSHAGLGAEGRLHQPHDDRRAD